MTQFFAPFDKVTRERVCNMSWSYRSALNMVARAVTGVLFIWWAILGWHDPVIWTTGDMPHGISRLTQWLTIGLMASGVNLFNVPIIPLRGKTVQVRLNTVEATVMVVLIHNGLWAALTVSGTASVALWVSYALDGVLRRFPAIHPWRERFWRSVGDDPNFVVPRRLRLMLLNAVLDLAGICATQGLIEGTLFRGHIWIGPGALIFAIGLGVGTFNGWELAAIMLGTHSRVLGPQQRRSSALQQISVIYFLVAGYNWFWGAMMWAGWTVWGLGGMALVHWGLWRTRQRVIVSELLAEEQAQRDQQYRMATTDVLTGLPNRRATEDYALQLARAQIPTAVVVVDIDWFKRINDTWGHDTGDFVLTQVAKLLQYEHRHPGPWADFVGRWGGEEFLLLWPQCPSTRAQDKCETLCSRIAQTPIVWTSESGVSIPIHLTVSVGLALWSPHPEPDHTPLEAFRWADRALYEVKRHGRNNWQGVTSYPPASPTVHWMRSWAHASGEYRENGGEQHEQ